MYGFWVCKRSACGTCPWILYLVVSLTQELEPLSSLVHEDAVKVARLHGADLDGLLAPAHDLVGADVR